MQVGRQVGRWMAIVTDRHTYIHMSIHTSIPTYIHTQIPTYLHTYHRWSRWARTPTCLCGACRTWMSRAVGRQVGMCEVIRWQNDEADDDLQIRLIRMYGMYVCMYVCTLRTSQIQLLYSERVTDQVLVGVCFRPHDDGGGKSYPSTTSLPNSPLPMVIATTAYDSETIQIWSRRQVGRQVGMQVGDDDDD